jgi:5-methylcytosine-specific restriction protein A
VPRAVDQFRMIDRPAAAQFDPRPTANQRGYTYRWQQARASFLRRSPLCAGCQRRGRITLAAELDHITPHRGDPRLFWDQTNWQPLCKSCHSRKTARGR